MERAISPRRAYPPIRRRDDANVGAGERVVSAVGGMGLLGWGLQTRGVLGWSTALLGAGLARHGLQRHCRLYDSLGVTADDASLTSSPVTREIRSRRAITIQASPERIYGEWRDVEGLHRFFPHVEQVRTLDKVTSRWKGSLMGHAPIEWEAIIWDDVENERITWRSVDSLVFDHRGAISFHRAPGGRGTEVTLELHARLPGGVVGAIAAKAMGTDPTWEAAEALRRLKQWVETGEIASAMSPARRDRGWTRGSLREEAFGGKTLPDQEVRPPSRTPLPTANTKAQPDRVDAASLESFPASDSPSFNAQSTSRRPFRRVPAEKREE